MKIILNGQEQTYLRLEAERAGVSTARAFQKYCEQMTQEFNDRIFEVINENPNQLKLTLDPTLYEKR